MPMTLRKRQMVLLSEKILPSPSIVLLSGMISKSVINDSFVGEDVQKQTDSGFVGANTIKAQDTYFAGVVMNSRSGMQRSLLLPQDNSKTAKDGVFIGQDVQKKTDGSFAGDNYGK